MPFQNADGHYNPNKTGHPDHAGDLPPVLANNGNAWMMFYTTRFYPEDIIGKTVVIHEKRDDFKTQPSGDAGAMIACGGVRGDDLTAYSVVATWKYCIQTLKYIKKATLTKQKAHRIINVTFRWNEEKRERAFDGTCGICTGREPGSF